MNHQKVLASFAMFLLFFVGSPQLSQAWETTTHEGRVYHILLEVGFTHEVASIIAQTSEQTDHTNETSPMAKRLLRGYFKRVVWHFSTWRKVVAHSSFGKMLHGAQIRLVAKVEPNHPMGSKVFRRGLELAEFILIGAGYHPKDDTYGHLGYEPSIGHGYDGQRTDMPYTDPEKWLSGGFRTIQQALAMKKVSDPSALRPEYRPGHKKYNAKLANRTAEEIQRDLLATPGYRNIALEDGLKALPYKQFATNYMLRELYRKQYIYSDINIDKFIQEVQATVATQHKDQPHYIYRSLSNALYKVLMKQIGYIQAHPDYKHNGTYNENGPVPIDIAAITADLKKTHPKDFVFDLAVILKIVFKGSGVGIYPLDEILINYARDAYLEMAEGRSFTDHGSSEIDERDLNIVGKTREQQIEVGLKYMVFKFLRRDNELNVVLPPGPSNKMIVELEDSPVLQFEKRLLYTKMRKVTADRFKDTVPEVDYLYDAMAEENIKKERFIKMTKYIIASTNYKILKKMGLYAVEPVRPEERDLPIAVRTFPFEYRERFKKETAKLTNYIELWRTYMARTGLFAKLEVPHDVLIDQFPDQLDAAIAAGHIKKTIITAGLVSEMKALYNDQTTSCRAMMDKTQLDILNQAETVVFGSAKSTVSPIK